jgi:hypothetical protein
MPSDRGRKNGPQGLQPVIQKIKQTVNWRRFVAKRQQRKKRDRWRSHLVF